MPLVYNQKVGATPEEQAQEAEVNRAIQARLGDGGYFETVFDGANAGWYGEAVSAATYNPAVARKYEKATVDASMYIPFSGLGRGVAQMFGRNPYPDLAPKVEQMKNAQDWSTQLGRAPQEIEAHLDGGALGYAKNLQEVSAYWARVDDRQESQERYELHRSLATDFGVGFTDPTTSVSAVATMGVSTGATLTFSSIAKTAATFGLIDFGIQLPAQAVSAVADPEVGPGQAVGTAAFVGGVSAATVGTLGVAGKAITSNISQAAIKKTGAFTQATTRQAVDMFADIYSRGRAAFFQKGQLEDFVKRAESGQTMEYAMAQDAQSVVGEFNALPPESQKTVLAHMQATEQKIVDYIENGARQKPEATPIDADSVEPPNVTLEPTADMESAPAAPLSADVPEADVTPSLFRKIDVDGNPIADEDLAVWGNPVSVTQKFLRKNVFGKKDYDAADIWIFGEQGQPLTSLFVGSTRSAIAQSINPMMRNLGLRLLSGIQKTRAAVTTGQALPPSIEAIVNGLNGRTVTPALKAHREAFRAARRTGYKGTQTDFDAELMLAIRMSDENFAALNKPYLANARTAARQGFAYVREIYKKETGVDLEDNYAPVMIDSEKVRVDQAGYKQAVVNSLAAEHIATKGPLPKVGTKAYSKLITRFENVAEEIRREILGLSDRSFTKGARIKQVGRKKGDDSVFLGRTIRYPTAEYLAFADQSFPSAMIRYYNRTNPRLAMLREAGDASGDAVLQVAKDSYASMRKEVTNDWLFPMASLRDRAINSFGKVRSQGAAAQTYREFIEEAGRVIKAIAQGSTDKYGFKADALNAAKTRLPAFTGNKINKKQAVAAIKDFYKNFDADMQQIAAPFVRQIEKDESIQMRLLAGALDGVMQTYPTAFSNTGANIMAQAVNNVRTLRYAPGYGWANTPDVWRAALIDGFGPVFGAVRKIITSKEFRDLALEQAQDMNQAVSLMTGTNLSRIDQEVFLHGGPATSFFSRIGSGFLRGTERAADISLTSGGFKHLMDGMQAASIAAQVNKVNRVAGEILSGSLEGKALQRAVREMAELGFSKDKLKAIKAQLDKYGDTIDGFRFANTQEWDDQALREMFEDRMQEAARKAILEPLQGDYPTQMNAPARKFFFPYWKIQYSLQQASLAHAQEMGLNPAQTRVYMVVAAQLAQGFLVSVAKLAKSGRFWAAVGAYSAYDWLVESVDRSGAGGQPWSMWFQVRRSLRALKQGDRESAIYTALGANVSTVGDMSMASIGLANMAMTAMGLSDKEDITNTEKRAIWGVVPFASHPVVGPGIMLGQWALDQEPWIEPYTHKDKKKEDAAPMVPSAGFK
jgi:hypothetical protein